jgi:pimeloyl-ACP methyl ester carboxylesterase
MSSTERDDVAPPAWFAQAIATEGESRFVEVEDCPIHYLRWGDPGLPALLFVPPSAAHAHWFDHVAPYFCDQFHVLAMDPSGCGDSGRRDHYTREQITAEIMGVFSDAGALQNPSPPVLVGHSAGAQCAVRAAMAHGETLAGVIAIEGLRYARLATDHAIKALEGPRPTPKPARVYASFKEAVGRFRLSPPSETPIDAPHVLAHIARHSVRPVDGGWTSKYDTAQGAVITLGFELKDELKDLRCPAASLYAEHSHLADATAAPMMEAITEGRVPVFRIPGATHYAMIDSPFAFISAIKGVALTWRAQRAVR